MSQLFDALKRYEAERAGIPLSAQPEAIDLLQRTEREEASKCEAAALSEGHNATKSRELRMPRWSQIVTENTSITDATEANEPFSPDQGLDMISLLQSKQVSLSPQSRMICLTDKESPAAEAFRLLGVRLRHLQQVRPLKMILITSTVPEEGKSMIAANLACSLAARTEQRILLLEGDVRRPSLSRVFGLGKNPGICEWLQGERSLMMCIYHLEGPELWILPAGSSPSNPLELVQSGRLSALMDQLAAYFDWIIIDSPPVLPLADASVWTQLADGILLVTRQGTTQKKQLQKGLDTLDAKKVIGAVLNSSKNAEGNDYYYRSPKRNQSGKTQRV